METALKLDPWRLATNSFRSGGGQDCSLGACIKHKHEREAIGEDGDKRGAVQDSDGGAPNRCCATALRISYGLYVVDNRQR